MGFDNPATPWSELERQLSGRPKPQSSAARRGHGDDRDPDGGDSPAWSRKRPAYQPPALLSSSTEPVRYAQLRGGAKGRPVYELPELAQLAAGNWLILTGCRKGRVAQTLGSDGIGDLQPADQALGELVELFGRDHVAVELTHALEPLADER